MKCKCCGKELGEFTLDISYELPDVVWSIPTEKRKDEAKFNSDLCQYKDRSYLRGIAYVPILETDTKFGWGFWVEVTEDVFNKYLEIYEVDGSHEQPVEGFLANTPPGYKNTNNLETKIHFGTPNDRPRIVIEPSEHKLAVEQTQGISVERVHELNKYIS